MCWMRSLERQARGSGFFLRAGNSRVRYGWEQRDGVRSVSRALEEVPPSSCQAGVCPDPGQPGEGAVGMQVQVEGDRRGSHCLGHPEAGPQEEGWAPLVHGLRVCPIPLPDPDFHCHACSSRLDIFNTALPFRATWLTRAAHTLWTPLDSPGQVCPSLEWVWTLNPLQGSRASGGTRSVRVAQDGIGRSTGETAPQGQMQPQAQGRPPHPLTAHRHEGTRWIGLVTCLSIDRRRSQPLSALPGLLPSHVLHTLCPAGWDCCHDHR